MRDSAFVMNNLAFIYALNIILISRLGFVLRDTPLKRKDLWYLIIFQFLGFLIFQMTWITILLLVLVIILNPLIYQIENLYQDRLIRIRIGFLLLYIFIFSFIFSKNLAPRYYPDLGVFMGKWVDHFMMIHWFRDFIGLKIQIKLMGLLLIINEVNLIIRLYFQTFDLIPRQDEQTTPTAPQTSAKAISTRNPIDVKEYNAGRVIGILERTLIYFFVLYNHFAAIGFVIAAKSFTRFRELNKRHFAEYVLIGTLLSSTLAIAVAELIKYLLENMSIG